MEIYQLKTFVAVAQEGTITRASERLCLSQPAVSAHIKAMEATLGLRLFRRTPQGMCLTADGERLLLKAEQTLAAHRAMLAEAGQIRATLTGTLRLGAVASLNADIAGRLLMGMAASHPEVEVSLQHGSRQQILDEVCNGTLDAALYNASAELEPGLSIVEVAQFAIHLAAPTGLIDSRQPLDWQQLARQPWICPGADTCCGRAAESLFQQHAIRPEKIISIDREQVTRTLIAGGVGIGLLHSNSAREAAAAGEVDLLCEVRPAVPVLLACRSERAQEPLFRAVKDVLQD